MAQTTFARAGSIISFMATLGLSTLHAQQPPAQGPLLLSLTGRGVQVYRCEAAGWTLDHPEADLLDARQKVVGHHDAGPSWHLDDGGTVKGALVQKDDSPEAGAIPWLLLRVTFHEGAGRLAGAETIRRTDTHGGVAPRQGCDAAMAGATVRVPYKALYSFYGQP